MAKQKVSTSRSRNNEGIKNLKWFSKNFSKSKMEKYAGEWVAIENKKILSSDKNINGVIKKVEKIDGNPTFVKIARKEEILIL